jgi:proteasome beta subunit
VESPKPWIGSSFVELLRQHTAPLAEGGDDDEETPADPGAPAVDLMHGTTVLAVHYVEGVVMAADRRAVSGSRIVLRDADKLFPTDRTSGIAVSGYPGPALEMVRLLQTEFEHYEKVEGSELSLDGKVNRLSSVLREHVPAAMLGLIVVPIFAGYDSRADSCRLFAFDPLGGRYEERTHCAAGSGATIATTTIALGLHPSLDRDGAVDLALEALHQAADQDAFTGGVDDVRGIYPSVAVIDAAGYRTVDDAELAPAVARLRRSA